jgi:hypothetical protein
MDGPAPSQSDYGIDVFLHDGLAYTNDTTLELVRNIEAFPVGEDDVIIVGFPKSGTNWMNVVLGNLYDHWETTKRTPGNMVPELSVPSRPAVGFQGYEACIASPSPRLMKTHLPYPYMPRAFREGKGKAIFIVRNPKDVCDSFYTNLQPHLHEGWGWDEHLDAFLRGTVPFGPWLDSVSGWYDQLGNERVLHLTYEGVQFDNRGALERIAEFVGPVQPGVLDSMLAVMDLKAMKQAGLDKQFQPSMTRREGKIGGWKKRFTVDQSERFDELIDKPLRASGIDLVYEA